jgi:hypothetical protein
MAAHWAVKKVDVKVEQWVKPKVGCLVAEKAEATAVT